MATKKSKSNFFAKNKKKIIISSIVFVLIAISAVVYFKLKTLGEESRKENQISQSLVNTSSLSHQVESDIIFGDINAPVTIIEYASLSCPHCANFYNNIFDKIKEEYIDSGKVRFIYRDFPLNQTALLGSVISACHAKNTQNDPVKYYNLVKSMFKTQESWAFSEDFFEKLKSIAKLNGITEKEFEDCSKDENLVKQILENRQKASQELNINSTPVFIINGEFIGGYREFEDFKKIIDSKLK